MCEVRGCQTGFSRGITEGPWEDSRCAETGQGGQRESWQEPQSTQDAGGTWGHLRTRASVAHEDSRRQSAGLDYMDTLPARLGSPAFSSSPDSHLRLLSMAADRMRFTSSKDRATCHVESRSFTCPYFVFKEKKMAVCKVAVMARGHNSQELTQQSSGKATITLFCV